MFGKKPEKTYERKDGITTRACSVCGIEISDDYCSKTDKNRCDECAGEVCFEDRKHKVIKKGKHYFCTACNEFIKDNIKYQRWINYNLPDVNVKIEKTD